VCTRASCTRAIWRGLYDGGFWRKNSIKNKATVVYNTRHERFAFLFRQRVFRVMCKYIATPIRRQISAVLNVSRDAIRSKLFADHPSSFRSYQTLKRLLGINRNRSRTRLANEIGALYTPLENVRFPSNLLGVIKHVPVYRTKRESLRPKTTITVFCFF